MGDWPSDSIRCFYTYSEFKSEYGAKKGFVYAHVPNSPGRRFAIPFYLGFKPEWRNRYSARWLRSSLMGFSPNIVYAFVCSIPCLEFSYWIAKKAKVPLAVHVADDIINEDNVEPIVREIMGYAKIRIAIYKIMKKSTFKHKIFPLPKQWQIGQIIPFFKLSKAIKSLIRVDKKSRK